MILGRFHIGLNLACGFVGFFKMNRYLTPKDKSSLFQTDVWVCFLPFLPLHITVIHRKALDQLIQVALQQDPLEINED